MNFLLVDDSPVIRKMVKIALKQVFIGQIFEASDGLEALNLMTLHPIDLIVCDVNMPNMDGMDLLAKLKETEDFSQIPVIMLSTEQGKEDIQEALTLGASDYLKKPLRPEQLIKAIYEVLKSH